MNSRQGPPPGTSPGETLAFILLGGALGLGVVLWTVGQVAGRLFGGAWPKVSSGEMGGVLREFPKHFSDPERAWPKSARALLPGPVGFYAVALLLIVVLLVVATVAVKLWRGASTAPRGSEHAARWAGRRDLRQLIVQRATAGRVTLGRLGRNLVAAEPRHSVLVVGPTQTGKTTGLAIPAILEWEGPVLATSVKTDLLRDTLAARQANGGSTWVYDPTQSTGFQSASWTPLAGAGPWAGAQRIATWLVESGRPAASGIASPDFWYATAQKLLAPLLLAAALGEGLTMDDVVRWVDTQEEDEVRWILDDAEEQAALRAFEATMHRESKSRSGAYTTAETVLGAYADPGVLATATQSDLTADRLLDGGHHTAYLCAPSHEQQRLQPLFATLVLELVTAVYERASRTGRPLDPPLLVVLDECANIAPIRQLATIAATGAGQGIQLVTVFQDMAQIDAVFGRDIAPTIVSNHRAKLLMAGIADPATLDYASKLVGEQADPHIAQTRGFQGELSSTESIQYRSLLPSHAVRQMTAGEALLIYGTLRPARLSLRPWFQDRSLRSKVPLNGGVSREGLPWRSRSRGCE